MVGLKGLIFNEIAIDGVGEMPYEFHYTLQSTQGWSHRDHNEQASRGCVWGVLRCP